MHPEVQPDAVTVAAPLDRGRRPCQAATPLTAAARPVAVHESPRSARRPRCRRRSCGHPPRPRTCAEDAAVSWPPGARGIRVRARCYRVQPAARGARGRTDRESVHPVRWRRPGATDGSVPPAVWYSSSTCATGSASSRSSRGARASRTSVAFHPTFSRLRFRGRPLSLSDWAAWSAPFHEARSHHRASWRATETAEASTPGAGPRSRGTSSPRREFEATSNLAARATAAPPCTCLQRESTLSRLYRVCPPSVRPARTLADPSGSSCRVSGGSGADPAVQVCLFT